MAPGGTVTFYSGATALGTATLVGTVGSGTANASLTTGNLPSSTGSSQVDALTFTYTGDTNYQSATLGSPRLRWRAL